MAFFRVLVVAIGGLLPASALHMEDEFSPGNLAAGLTLAARHLQNPNVGHQNQAMPAEPPAGLRLPSHVAPERLTALRAWTPEMAGEQMAEGTDEPSSGLTDHQKTNILMIKEIENFVSRGDEAQEAAKVVLQLSMDEDKTIKDLMTESDVEGMLLRAYRRRAERIERAEIDDVAREYFALDKLGKFTVDGEDMPQKDMHKYTQVLNLVAEKQVLIKRGETLSVRDENRIEEIDSQLSGVLGTPFELAKSFRKHGLAAISEQLRGEMTAADIVKISEEELQELLAECNEKIDLLWEQTQTGMTANPFLSGIEVNSIRHDLLIAYKISLQDLLEKLERRWLTLPKRMGSQPERMGQITGSAEIDQSHAALANLDQCLRPLIEDILMYVRQGDEAKQTARHFIKLAMDGDKTMTTDDLESWYKALLQRMLERRAVQIERTGDIDDSAREEYAWDKLTRITVQGEEMPQEEKDKYTKVLDLLAEKQELIKRGAKRSTHDEKRIQDIDTQLQGTMLQMNPFQVAGSVRKLGRVKIDEERVDGGMTLEMMEDAKEELQYLLEDCKKMINLVAEHDAADIASKVNPVSLELLRTEEKELKELLRELDNLLRA